MDKQKKYFILGGIIVLVVLIILILVSLGDKNKANVDQNANNAALSPEVNSPTSATVEEARPAAPVYTKKVELEIMTAAEMKKMGFEPGSKVQVLGRDASGTVTAYRVMQNDQDIMEYYGN